MSLNETHDPGLRSWVETAQVPGTDFPIQNLPFGVFRRAGSAEALRGGVAIGDQILDLGAAVATGAFGQASVGVAAARAVAAAAQPTLNELMGSGAEAAAALRLMLSRALRRGSAQEAALRSCLVPQSGAEHALPARIGDYTDFYASIHHAMAVGRLFRPDNPLLPNYKWVPVAYHGRSSSIGVSGQAFARPVGQILAGGSAVPTVAPSARLDYELELGAFVGRGNAAGERIAASEAESHLFGLCLLNDWSARDIQAWEYQPLGPFLAKSFATTLSPWVVTLEALEPYRLPWSRSPTDPQPLPYLDFPDLRSRGALDIQLEACVQSEAMRRTAHAPHRLSRSSFKHSYWTLAQMVAHHTVSGCNLQPGDLIGTGTQSGPAPQEAGSLLELTRSGAQPLTLPSGETRRFLEDGDSIILRAWCERAGAARIGFGEAAGRVLPARN
ncbi:MAG TPA: fumarylacetoacetase [Steroidobacteraceae bacterium]|nr:fumarylacetoacetase [Steroidobacteraceae bacterium]